MSLAQKPDLLFIAEMKIVDYHRTSEALETVTSFFNPVRMCSHISSSIQEFYVSLIISSTSEDDLATEIQRFLNEYKMQLAEKKPMWDEFSKFLPDEQARCEIRSLIIEAYKGLLILDSIKKQAVYPLKICPLDKIMADHNEQGSYQSRIILAIKEYLEDNDCSERNESGNTFFSFISGE
jgi:hypothetical protein